MSTSAQVRRQLFEGYPWKGAEPGAGGRIMISLIEALHYRSLRYVRQPLSRFQRPHPLERSIDNSFSKAAVPSAWPLSRCCTGRWTWAANPESKRQGPKRCAPSWKALRPAVIQRKISHGVQSSKGALCSSRLLTVTTSRREQGRDVWAFLEQTWIADRLRSGVAPCSALGRAIRDRLRSDASRPLNKYKAEQRIYANQKFAGVNSYLQDVQTLGPVF